MVKIAKLKKNPEGTVIFQSHTSQTNTRSYQVILKLAYYNIYSFNTLSA